MQVIRCRGSKEACHTGDILRSSPSLGRDSCKDLGVSGLVIDQSGVHLGSHVSGSDRIDVHALARPLVSEGLGDLSYAALAGCICGNGILK